MSGSGGRGTDGNTITFSFWRLYSDRERLGYAAQRANGTSDGVANGGSRAVLLLGLGVCNDNERASGGTCTTNPPEHAIGNTASYDFVLLTFSQPVTSDFPDVEHIRSLQQDTDATYFTGTCTTVNGCTPLNKTVTGGSSTIGGSTGNGSFSSFYAAPESAANPITGTRTFTLNLGSQSSVNWVLIGASTFDSTPERLFQALEHELYHWLGCA